MLHSVHSLPGSPRYSHHLRSHHLSLPRPFTLDLKLISFTNPFLHSHSYSFRTAFTVLTCTEFMWALAFLCVIVSLLLYIFLVTCARLSRTHSVFESMLNSSIILYRIVFGVVFTKAVNLSILYILLVLLPKNLNNAHVCGIFSRLY